MVVNGYEQDLVEVVHQHSGGRGADLVCECSGTAASLATCWEAVRKKSTLAPLGVYPGPITTDFNRIMMKELRVIGSYGYVWTSWQRTVQLLSNAMIRADELISHEFPLEDYERAFRVTQCGSGVKLVLNPELRHARVAN